MTENSTKTLTYFLLGIIGIIFIYFLIATALNGFWIWGKSLNMEATGQFGDFIGGFLGSIINGAAFYFLYLTLKDQRESSQKQSFETKIYDLIRIHRENVNDLNYTKFENGEMHTSTSRKVFRVMVGEFLEIYHETKRFTKIYPNEDYLKPEYYDRLKTIKENNKCTATVEQLALIDIAYSFFYYGLSKESETILLHKFYNRYNKDFAHQLKVFLQLKPKKELLSEYKLWNDFKKKSVQEMKSIFEVIYKYSLRKKNAESIEENYPIVKNLYLKKYYGGHQHRLGHYFRHLFQSFKFISMQYYLDDEEKYFFAKSIRTQFSTYEQFMIFFNSISSQGMRWEYLYEVPNSKYTLKEDDFKFISTYCLIKNLPGSQYYDFSYRQFYPNVIFEYRDDITYTNKIRKNYKQ